jgi:N-acetylmuramoyl-L-alanine amidase
LNLFLKLTLVFFIFTAHLSAIDVNNTKYKQARRNYAKIIGKNDIKKEIKYLKQLIHYGKKIKTNIYKYQVELKRVDKKTKYRRIIKPKKPKVKIRKIKKVKKPKKIKKLKKLKKLKIAKLQNIKKIRKKSKYEIASVSQVGNKIIIKFNKNITKKDIRYFFQKSKRGYQYNFNLNGKFKDAKPTVLAMENVNKIKIFQYKTNILRISFTNKSKLKPIYSVKNRQIVITIYSKKIKKSNFLRVPLLPNQMKQKIVVIDAGHGGKDSGAVGKHRRYEKNVTLKIGNYLYTLLKKKGYLVYRTRSRDKFVSLKYRTKLANLKKADMFISLHANSTVKSKINTSRGIETYFLSPARSARAKRVAAKENKGDMGDMDLKSQGALLTVLNQGKITASNKMAIDIHSNILFSLRKRYGAKEIVDGGVREGPFGFL